MDYRDYEPIPQPPGYPIVGNLFDMNVSWQEEPMDKIDNLARIYDFVGEIVKIQILKCKVITVHSYAMLNELCDERRFEKAVHPSLKELRDGVHDGLFTAYNHEKNWEIAHRTLVPAFGPLSVSDMFPLMKDIASQLVLKWLRYGPEHEIQITEDFTRLTLDTISLCSMTHRFNSFYTEEVHPFVRAMADALKYTDLRGWVPNAVRPYLFRPLERKYKDNIKLMRKLAREIIKGRVRNPRPEINDLLNIMINGRDPKTGCSLTNESIVDNLLTLLIAGHETTSGMLSFTMYYLLRDKEAYRKVQAEVDAVVGKDSVELELLSKLPYINAVLRESARLMPTAPAKHKVGATLAGKYHIEQGDDVIAILKNCHRDRAAFGDDAELFRPERMLDENFKNLPPNAWKTFGNGKRGCIGRGFAWQEMQLIMAMLFQHFDFEIVDPDYKLHIAFTLTVKPKDLRVRAIPRVNVNLSSLKLNDIHEPSPNESLHTRNKAVQVGKSITILYGSNSGTCESLARTLATDAPAHGFTASKIISLDQATNNLPKDEPVVMITASYEGQPTDDATHFFRWLGLLNHEQRLSTEFAVFGCGHADWKQTFHKIPTLLEESLVQHGAQRLCDIGLADASKGNVMSDFQYWEDTILWPAMKQRYSITPTDYGTSGTCRGITVEISKQDIRARSDTSEAKVLSVMLLTSPGEPPKRQIVLQLPAHMSYRAGDYCLNLPFNPQVTIRRVMTRFSLPLDATLRVSSQMATTMPTDQPLSAYQLLGAYVELSQPATHRDIAMLIRTTTNKLIQEELLALADNFDVAITEKRVSLLDILERYPSIHLSLSEFVASLIPMRMRQYSIASSPLANAHELTLAYDILDQPSLSGGARHIGVASNYLSSLQPGDILHASIRVSPNSFHLPDDNESETTPIIMVAAGAGIAPFRGFVQERVAKIATGRHLAPAHLFFGCRGPDHDDLYRTDLDNWEKLGAVVTHRAYSRAPSLSNGCRHIDQTLLAESKLLKSLWSRGAKVYVCGSRAVGESVKQAFLSIACEIARDEGRDDAIESIQQWFEGIRNKRYMMDVFN